MGDSDQPTVLDEGGKRTQTIGSEWTGEDFLSPAKDFNVCLVNDDFNCEREMIKCVTHL